MGFNSAFIRVNTLHALTDLSQLRSPLTDAWADVESNEFWMMWKDGVESYFGKDAKKLSGASTANNELSCLPRTKQKCQSLKHDVRMVWMTVKLCCPWKQIFNKFTFSATRHVQTCENPLISLNVPMFWFFYFLLLISEIMSRRRLKACYVCLQEFTAPVRPSQRHTSN